MDYRTIPGTEIRISRLALGGWLTLGDALAPATSLQLLHCAKELGVNFFDLADVYGNGGAERVVGQFLREVPRDTVIVSSKVFWPTSDDPADRGLSRQHIQRSIDRSLQRLGTDYLDLYFCHREDPTVPLAETVRAMGELVAAGKIRAWGTSCWRPATLRQAHQLAKQLGVASPRIEQPPYSLLERSIENDVLPACRKLGMAVAVWSPLAGGVLTGKYLAGTPAGSRAATSGWLERHLAPSRQQQVRAFVAECERQDCYPATAALAWALATAGVDCAITGATSSEQLRNNIAASDLRMTTEQLEALARCFPAPPTATVMRILRRLFGKA
jgi:aryl-alcohol dehydrogenase-like predicted oxidoreductase